MKKVVFTCDYPGCAEQPVARVYMRVMKRYRSGERVPGTEESLGSADFCQEHFEPLAQSIEETWSRRPAEEGA